MYRCKAVLTVLIYQNVDIALVYNLNVITIVVFHLRNKNITSDAFYI